MIVIVEADQCGLLWKAVPDMRTHQWYSFSRAEAANPQVIVYILHLQKLTA